MTVGIVCEYNPFHLGHAYQINCIRQAFGPDTRIVCAMSGQFVQRGAPALLDKSLRAGAAVACGADLVLELPVTTSLSSAEGFATGAISILSTICDTLCCGAETADRETIFTAARALLSPAFSEALRQSLSRGKSFPAARQKALEQLGIPALTGPNDLLAVEYAKAILCRNSTMDLFPIHRIGSYHARELDQPMPSATAIREAALTGRPWHGAVPEAALPYLANGTLHTLQAGERAVLYRLRTMTDAEFEELPYGSEGLWRKLMHESRRQEKLEDILIAVKSKRYTRTRLDRMVLCAFLGISGEMLTVPASYIRVLAFSEAGRMLLSRHKRFLPFRNPGEPGEGIVWELEKRAGDVYGLFALNHLESPGMEEKRRVLYIR